jgi:ribonuclease-3
MTKPEPHSSGDRPKPSSRSAKGSASAALSAPTAIEHSLGHVFADKSLLETALCHPSLVDVRKISYERLEFLGDAVLGLVIAEHLYHRFPDADEGELTRIKSSVVSRAALAHLGKRLKIVDHLDMGKGMQNQGPIPRSVAANATEALIGALHVDAGLERAKQFVLEQLGDLIRRSSIKRSATNHKSLLQLHTQRLALGTPTYETLKTSGPDHERTFEVRATLGGRVFPSATGANKKRAEQRAAKLALRILESEEKGSAPPRIEPDDEEDAE